MKESSTPWVFRLPRGMWSQPSQIFIGTLVGLGGLGYLLGVAKSNSIAALLDPIVLRVWGGFLFVSGVLLVYSTIRGNLALERMALRFLSSGLLVYMGWVLTAVSAGQGTLTVIMCMCLAGTAEIRSAVIKALMRPIPPKARELME